MRDSKPATATSASRVPLKIAGAASATLGVGFGVPCLYGIWYLVRHDEIATFLGFPTYGEGPFESAGLTTTVPLLVAFLAVCVAEVGVGWLLWGGRRGGPLLALVLLPLELVFWIGFALPFGPLLGVTRTAAVLVALRAGSVPERVPDVPQA